MHNSSTRGPGIQAASHLFLSLLTVALVACGGGGGGTEAPAMTNSSITSSSPGPTDSAGNAALPTGSSVTPHHAAGEAFRVNADAAGRQTLADIGTLQAGGHAIAWVSTDGAAPRLHLQRFDAAGQRSGADLSVPLAANETDTTVAVLPDGSLAVASLQTGAASPSTPWITRTSVVLRRYDASGTPTVAPLQVASIDQDRTAAGPMHSVAAPQLVHWDDGSFLLAWSQVQDDAAGKVPQFWARRFDAAGQPIGLNVPIGQGVAGSSLQLVAAHDGGFVIATTVSAGGGRWLMYRGFDGVKTPVQPADALGAAEGSVLLPLQGGAQLLLSPVKNVVALQLYDAQGQAQGGDGALPAMPVGMTALRDGGFLLVTAGAAGSLHAQRYDAAGQAIGSGRTIAASAGATQGVALADGSVALAWTANSGGDQDVMAARLAP